MGPFRVRVSQVQSGAIDWATLLSAKQDRGLEIWDGCDAGFPPQAIAVWVVPKHCPRSTQQMGMSNEFVHLLMGVLIDGGGPNNCMLWDISLLPLEGQTNRAAQPTGAQLGIRHSGEMELNKQQRRWVLDGLPFFLSSFHSFSPPPFSFH